MRLIDADDFFERMKNDTDLCAEMEKYGEKALKKYLDLQPTVYSVDKVVAELEELQKEYLSGFGVHDDNEMYGVACGLGDAIKIVKRGGVNDDVCEWIKQYKNYDWQPSCETNSVYNVAGVGWFKFCPYCGKKIMVVE